MTDTAAPPTPADRAYFAALMTGVHALTTPGSDGETMTTEDER